MPTLKQILAEKQGESLVVLDLDQASNLTFLAGGEGSDPSTPDPDPGYAWPCKW